MLCRTHNLIIIAKYTSDAVRVHCKKAQLPAVPVETHALFHQIDCNIKGAYDRLETICPMTRNTSPTQDEMGTCDDGSISECFGFKT